MRTTGVGAPFLWKLWRGGVLASIVALSLVFLLTVTAFADTVNIYDQAHVLNGSQIRNAASSLRYPLSIYTVNNFNGSPGSFDQRTLSHVTRDNIVMSISTNLRHMALKSGSNVPLSSSGANSAVNAFISSYAGTNNYTAATISSINSLKSTLGSSGPGNNTGSGFSIPGISGGCLIGLVILGLLLFLVLRRKRKGSPYTNPNYGQAYPPNAGQAYPPNYGPGNPNYPQNQGVNPLAAGGLGAAAGGFLGYELGKERGEREARDRDQGNYGGNEGGFGGGSSGDFGGDSGGDLGGGSSGDFGGGSDGGSSGDFGSGSGGGSSGDFGGGSGGGSSGNF